MTEFRLGSLAVEGLDALEVEQGERVGGELAGLHQVLKFRDGILVHGESPGGRGLALM